MVKNSKTADPVGQLALARSISPEPDDASIRESRLAFLLEHPTASDIDPGRVRSAFKESNVWVLGFPDDLSESEGTQMLHFIVDDDSGIEKVRLPAFTSKHALRQAVLLNSEWQALTVLEVRGGELLQNLQADVTVAVDPWTPLEYLLPLE